MEEAWELAVVSGDVPTEEPQHKGNKVGPFNETTLDKFKGIFTYANVISTGVLIVSLIVYFSGRADRSLVNLSLEQELRFLWRGDVTEKSLKLNNPDQFKRVVWTSIYLPGSDLDPIYGGNANEFIKSIVTNRNENPEFSMQGMFAHTAGSYFATQISLFEENNISVVPGPTDKKKTDLILKYTPRKTMGYFPLMLQTYYVVGSAAYVDCSIYNVNFDIESTSEDTIETMVRFTGFNYSKTINTWRPKRTGPAENCSYSALVSERGEAIKQMMKQYSYDLCFEARRAGSSKECLQVHGEAR